MEPSDALVVECDVDVGAEPRHNLAYRAARGDGRGVRARAGRAHRVWRSASRTVRDLAAAPRMQLRWSPDSRRCGGSTPRTRAASQRRSSVGADVPFFSHRRRLCADDGARRSWSSEPSRRSPASRSLLVRPPEPVSTAAAYAAFDADPQPEASAEAVIAALEARDAGGAWRGALQQHRPRHRATVVPAVAEALAWTRSQDGVLGAAVAGSGSAVFAVATRRVRRRGCGQSGARPGGGLQRPLGGERRSRCTTTRGAASEGRRGRAGWR